MLIFSYYRDVRPSSRFSVGENHCYRNPALSGLFQVKEVFGMDLRLQVNFKLNIQHRTSNIQHHRLQQHNHKKLYLWQVVFQPHKV